MAQVSSTEVVVAGVRSPVRTAGPSGASEAIVFVHGNPGSSEDWVDLLSAAGDFSRAVAPDMPGYGKADRPRGFDYTVQGYARHLDGVLRELGVERVHLVLHDFGGAWGLAWAAGNGPRLASLMLVNVGVMPGYKWHKYARVWRTPVLGEISQLIATRRAFHAVLNAENPKPFPPAFLDRMYDDSDWGMKRAVLKLYRSTNLAADGARLGEILRPLKIKTLVVWGEGDPFVSSRYAEVQKEYFDAEVHVLPGCGHWPMVDEPDRVRELVVPFWKARVSAAT